MVLDGRGRPRVERVDTGSLTVDDRFDASEPIRSAEDLPRDGMFDEGEVEEFLADLYAMRRSDVP